MNKEQLAERYACRIKRCFGAIKILVAISMAAIAVLVIFVLVAKGINLQDTNTGALLAGIIVPVSIAVAGVIGALVTLIVATFTVTKLKKLD